MISSHTRVLSMLLGFLFAASSPAFAAGDGADNQPAPESSSPALAPSSKTASAPASVANTAPPTAVVSHVRTGAVVVTTDRLFINAQPQAARARVVITTEPLLVQAAAQK